MNETPNSDPENPGSENQSHGSANQSSHSSKRVFDSVRDAINEGAQQARAAAEEAIPRVRAAVNDATYWLGYSVSFAAVFSYTVVTELAPEVLKTGAHDGTEAGRKAAEDFTRARKSQPVQPAEPSGPIPETGLV
jgi:hypothetical protein